MGIDVSGFTTPPTEWGGLYKAADTLERRSTRDELLRMRQDAQKSANASSIERMLNPNDYFTGTDYDPIILKRLDAAKQQAFQLASQGLSTPDIMMTVGPQVSELTQYAQKARMADASLKSDIAILGQQKGYLTKSIYEGAKQMMFMNPDGKTLKDINQVDPSQTQQYVTDFVKNHPDEATDYSGLRDYAKGMAMTTDHAKVGYEEGGVHRVKEMKYSAHPWMHPEADGKGGFQLGVMGEDKPDKYGDMHRLMDKNTYRLMFENEPAMYNRLRGDVFNTYKALGAAPPDENTPEWDYAARKHAAELAKQYGGGMIYTNKDENKKSFVGKQEAGVPLFKPKEDKTVQEGILNRKK